MYNLFWGRRYDCDFPTMYILFYPVKPHPPLLVAPTTIAHPSLVQMNWVSVVPCVGWVALAIEMDGWIPSKT